MAHYSNGNFPASVLTTFQGMPVSKVMRAKLVKLEKLLAKEKLALHMAKPAGGYRSDHVQLDMHNPARKAFYDITIPLTALAAVGASPHGGQNTKHTYHAVDLESGNRARLIALAKKVGLVQRAAGTDPNCYIVKGQ
jgi:hypothetical protein